MDIDYRIELKYLDTEGSERDCQIYIFSLSLKPLSLSLNFLRIQRGFCSGDSIESAILSHFSSGIPRLLLSICVFSQNIMFQIFKVRNINIYIFKNTVLESMLELNTKEIKVFIFFFCSLSLFLFGILSSFWIDWLVNFLLLKALILSAFFLFSLSVKIFMNSVRIIYYDFDFIFCLKIFLSVSGCGNFLFSMFVSIIIWVFLFLFFGVVIVLLLLEFMPLSLQGFLYGLNVWIPTLVLVFWYSWISSNTHLDYLNGFFFFLRTFISFSTFWIFFFLFV